MIRARILGLPVLAIAALLASAPATAAGPPIDTIAFDESITLDPIGDASIAITFTLSASQYVNWQQKYGQNKSLLRRDLGKLVSQYETYNWDVQTNEMERRLTVSVNAHGAVKHRGGGQYELEVPPSWRAGPIQGTTLEYNYVESLGVGVVGQHNVKVILPPGTHDIAQGSGESGEPVVRYTVPVPHRVAAVALLVSGLTTILIGAGLIAFALLFRRPRSGALRPASVGNLPTTSAPGRG